ncbi:hypothetical protein DSO57_1039426 [Entomophthora muscae]|uniref:Uncharacterized protein n=1 Tax=Entomophthora muscae TaxID=34485 RepID=A0ACC2SMG7_9FUNG|nr:hypothetical protein DSO57_1039426 [Entomophthora muscae]
MSLADWDNSLRIGNFPHLETQVQEEFSNPGPDYLLAASPKDQEAIFPCFFGTKPPQAEAANTFQDKNTRKS